MERFFFLNVRMCGIFEEILRLVGIVKLKELFWCIFVPLRNFSITKS